MIHETYYNIHIGDKVVYRENLLYEKCIVKDISYKGNLKVFKLVTSSEKTFEVSVDKFKSAQCPWYFDEDVDTAWIKK
jgi:hypothetical protein